MRQFIVTMAFVLFLAGCSGGSNNEGSIVAVVGSTATVGSSEASGEGLVLNDFLPGVVGFDVADAEQQYLQQERSAQDRIAACMAEQGFDYIPYVPSQDQGGFSGPDSEEEFVERYGFGVATVILEDTQIDEEGFAAAMEAERAKNPNFVIVEAMTPEEQQEYNAALYGLGPNPGDPLVEDGPNSTVTPSDPSGCLPIAYEEIYNDDTWAAFDEQFGVTLEDMRSTVESDPRIAELESKWSTCMAEEGYDFVQKSDVRGFLFRRLADIGAIANLEIDATGQTMSWGRVEIEPGGPIEAAVKEIVSEEIAMAKISLACSGDRDDVYQVVYREAEQRFIQENLSELEQFKKDHL